MAARNNETVSWSLEREGSANREQGHASSHETMAVSDGRKALALRQDNKALNLQVHEDQTAMIGASTSS